MGATDRRTLRVCLDCFRAVLQDARPETAAPVVAFLDALLQDPARRRTRRRVLLTAAWIGRASMAIMPSVMKLRKRPRTQCVWKAARTAAVCIPWAALIDGDDRERAAAIAAFERLGSLGLLNLEHFLATQVCDAPTRSLVHAAVERLVRQFTGGPGSVPEE